jgi:hypothetical protein
MAMAMDKSLVLMGVFMDQVHPQEEVQVIQDLIRGTLGDQGMIFSHNIGPIGDFFQNGEVVG